MDRIEKELQKLSSKERSIVKEIISKLATGQTQGLNTQRLKGSSDILRVRKGDLRIIYRQAGDKIFVLRIARRSEKTYQ